MHETTCGTTNKLPITVAFLLPEECFQLIALYRRKLAGSCLRFDELETAHLTVKYLGYCSPSFSERHVAHLIPRIAELTKSFVPMNIAIRGIDLFETHPDSSPVVFLKVLSCGQLSAMHEALRLGLSKEIEPFPHADGENYIPHITLSKNIDLRRQETVKKLIFRSKKTAKRHFTLSELVLLTPTAIHPITRT